MSSNPWRSIAPASRGAPPPGQKPPIRPSIPVACLHCRLKKAKCDGARPSCTRCQDAELSCQYDVTQGVTRAERFRLQKQRQASVTNNLTLLVDALRSGSDLEATTLLARLRLGEGVEELLKDLGTVASASQDPPGRTASPANSSTGTAYSELATDHVDRPPSGSDNLGVMNRLGTTGLDVDEPFLSILFKLDELLHTLQEDVPDTEEDCSMPVSVPMLYGSSGMVSSRDLHAHETNPSIVHEPFSDITAPLRALVANRNAPWITYPKAQDNLIIAPSFQVHPSNIALSVSGAFVPLWAMMSVNLKSQRDPLYSAFKSILNKATNLIRTGTPPEEVFGDQPDIAALLDEEGHKKASLLTQWAASMVHSVRKKGNDFTCFASMHLFWYLMRWMILPSQDTYEAVPEWLRPTPNQLFLPHIYMMDFVVWPKLREFAVSTPPMQEKMDWLVDLSTHIRCHWPFGIGEATCKDAETGLTVLTDQAKKQMSDLSNWSVGPTFRAHVPNADMYVSVRSEYG